MIPEHIHHDLFRGGRRAPVGLLRSSPVERLSGRVAWIAWGRGRYVCIQPAQYPLISSISRALSRNATTASTTSSRPNLSRPVKLHSQTTRTRHPSPRSLPRLTWSRLPVGVHLFGPVAFATDRGLETSATLVAMPEATIHEHRSLEAREDHIWPSGQIGGMEAIAKPSSMKGPAERDLGLGVLRPDPAHVQAALGRRQNIQ